jgi:hypothetical protein
MLNSEEATSDANERRTAARIERTYYSVFCLTYVIPAARGRVSALPGAVLSAAS